MSLADNPLAILAETVYLEVFQSQKHLQTSNISKNLTTKPTSKACKSSASPKGVCNSRSSDSGKSSSGSPILLDYSFDSGIAGVLRDGNDMQLHNRIQQCQFILLAIERDQEYFSTIRNRLSKITKTKQIHSSENENELFCNVCCAEIDSSDEKTYVKCCICKKIICRNDKCADWLPKTAEWECELCQTSKESLAQTSSWVAEQITFNQEKIIRPPRARSEIYIPISEYNDSLIHFESVSQIGANSTTITAEQKFKIREYVEQIVAKLLGGNLDTIAVNQLSKSENCLPDPKVEKINNGTSQESLAVRAKDFSEISETRLRQMIQKVIAETLSLPPLTNGHAKSGIALDGPGRTCDNKTLKSNGYYQGHRTEHYFEPTIYQDLLATAILNKIVDKQLNRNRNVPERNNSSGGGGNDDINDNIKLANPDQNFNVEKLSTSSGSSVEPQSDCSYPEVEQILNNNGDKSSELLRNSDRDSVMSDYLANHMIPLPDLSATATESEDDDYTSVTSSAVGDGTWEKNWLFKKKKSTLSSSVTASSVGMLVPDPKEDVRAQIGDKTADEVSDLSELGSDSDDSLNSLRSQLEPINDRLINKHLIGGQNSKLILDELIERSSVISNCTLPTVAEPIYADACNEHIIEAATKNEAINDNVNQPDVNSNSLKGSIAEREYKKWYNAVEMPNNPYAPEALKRRISGSQERVIDLPKISPTNDLSSVDLINEPKLHADENTKLENDYKRYSRDYYINSSIRSPHMSPGRDVPPPAIKDNREPTTKTTSSTEIETKMDLYKAIPAQVIETNSSSMEAMSTLSTEVQPSFTSLSEDSDTLKINDAGKQQDSSAVIKDIAAAKRRDQGAFDTLDSEERPTCSTTRGSTPVAFKFLQPKRKLLEPNQVLTVDEEGPQTASSLLEKPVIEEEVVKALPSVKALARAFLLTTNTGQPEKLWLRKARTLSQGGRKRPTPSKTPSDQYMQSDRLRPEDDVTITSELSSLETDSSSVGTELATTSNLTASSTNDPSSPTAAGNISPVVVRQGVLKNNIAFFENLKNK